MNEPADATLLEPRVLKAGNRGPFTLDGTRSFLIGRERVAVIDPGPDDETHVRALLSSLQGASVVRVLLTHHHGDHARGAPALAEALGVSVEGPPSAGFEPLSLDDSIVTDQGELVPVATPGHTRDHLSFHWAGARAVFVGDLLLGRGTTTWLGEYPGCVADYLGSLEILSDLRPRTLFPAHGPKIRDPQGAIQRFREHRRERLDHLREARRRAPDGSPERLAREVYGGDLPPGLVRAAISSVQVMLHHLDSGEGQA